MPRRIEQAPRERIPPPFERPTTIAGAERILDHLFELAHQEADQGRDTLLSGLNTPAYLMVVINTIINDCEGLDEHYLMDAFERRLQDLAPKALEKLRNHGIFGPR